MATVTSASHERPHASPVRPRPPIARGVSWRGPGNETLITPSQKSTSAPMARKQAISSRNIARLRSMCCDLLFAQSVQEVRTITGMADSLPNTRMRRRAGHQS